uniref:MAP7 domain containing 2b n=1 Tax=Electrophorus electricus TaxID=8005 RepID=A0AAY5EB99_ELEEL
MCVYAEICSKWVCSLCSCACILTQFYVYIPCKDDTSKKDKVILAKKRREEREKVQESRVQEVWEKEQRAQRQYERSMEERGRRLEAQRQREEQRRVAVEEKRRRRVEEEKERLEALMRRSVERSPQLEQRPKRWTWGASEGESTEKAGGERGFTHVFIDSTVKRTEAIITPTKSSTARKNQSTPKRSQHLLILFLITVFDVTKKYRLAAFGRSTCLVSIIDFLIVLCDAKGLSHVRVVSSLPAPRESPVTPTGKAGTADAEEASRLLAERRRLARVQKEQEEKQRLEEERLRAEELQRRQAEERERQEQAAREAEEERQRQEEERRKKEADDRRQKERRFRELQEQLDREVRTSSWSDAFKASSTYVVRINSLPVRDSESSTFAEVKNYESPASVTTDSPIINPLPLEPKVIAADDLSDGVQSMDVSPVSRDELISIQEYSPVNEGSPNSMRNSQALGGLLDLTSDAPYPKAPVGAALGDCNKNLIPGFSIVTMTSWYPLPTLCPTVYQIV